MNKKYLAIITARGGSKRLPNKNTLDLCGKPLISWSIEAALKSQKVDAVLITSDSDKILNISKDLGANTIKRPDYLASDTATSFDAIIHALDNFDKYEYIILLQPTSPLRREEHIDEAIEFLEEKKADAVISVCEVEHSPLWCNTLDNNMDMSNFLNEEIKNLRSQDLQKYYRLNGAIYICKREELLKQKTFFIDSNIYAYKMTQEESVDIDTKLDFLVAQAILGEKNEI